MNISAYRVSDYAAPVAFVGNSLLAPLSQTEQMGIDPEFWSEFPDFGDAGAAAAIEACSAIARSAQESRGAGSNPVQDISVEYTALFIGPPNPAAPPWETAYETAGSYVGFGEPTFQMRDLLRKASVRLSGANNQYEDHMGIELLLLAEYCSSDEPNFSEMADYIEKHPLSWIAQMAERTRSASTAGYYAALLQLAEAILESLMRLLRSR